MEDLFTAYTQAWDLLDANAIAELYRLPCALADGDGVKTFTDKSQLTEKFVKNCEAMRGFGYKKAHFNIISQTTLSDAQSAVTVGWLIETEKQNIEFRTLYICHLIDHKWQIFNANVYQGSFNNSAQ